MEDSQSYLSRERTPPPLFPNKAPARERMGAAIGRDLSKLTVAELEDMLNRLSAEELEELNCDFDPDNSLLPPSARCRDQTEKTPTGPFNRDKLLEYLEESAKNEKDWNEPVPFVSGIKRGKAFEPKPHDPSEDDENDPELARIQLDLAPIQHDNVDGDEEQDEVDIALQGAAESDLVDLAGLLGMHNLLTQPQYYNAIKLKPQDSTTGTSFRSVVQGTVPTPLADEPPNTTNVENCIEKLNANDPKLTDVNVNNMKNMGTEKIHRLIQSAMKSEHLEKFSLANVAASDKEMMPLIDLVKCSTSLKSVNVESNFLSGDFLAKLMRATLKTRSLNEVHAENQRHNVLGNKIEMDIASTVDANEALLRVGIPLQSMEARNRVAEAVERNYENCQFWVEILAFLGRVDTDFL